MRAMHAEKNNNAHNCADRRGTDPFVGSAVGVISGPQSFLSVPTSSPPHSPTRMTGPSSRQQNNNSPSGWFEDKRSFRSTGAHSVESSSPVSPFVAQQSISGTSQHGYAASGDSRGARSEIHAYNEEYENGIDGDDEFEEHW